MFDRMKAAPNQVVEHLPGPDPQIDLTDWRATVNGTRPTCAYPGCEDASHPKAGGSMCKRHYAAVRAGEPGCVARSREKRTGPVFPMTPQSVERFMAKVVVINGCWLWTARTYYPKRGGRVCRACNSRAVTCPQCGNQVSRQNLAAHTRRNHGKERS